MILHLKLTLSFFFVYFFPSILISTYVSLKHGIKSLPPQGCYSIKRIVKKKGHYTFDMNSLNLRIYCNDSLPLIYTF
jgi:hypothetical protein